MAHELQKANLWKRIAAWLFDGILLGILAVAFGVLLSALLGYDGYSDTFDRAYLEYEAYYGVTFEIPQSEYEALPEDQKANYDAAYAALIGDQEAMDAYSNMMSLTPVILSIGILLAVVLWEFVIPLWLGNGQTLGKKIFGLCLVRVDGVRLSTLQLFVRSILGKYTVEIMIPVLIMLMIFWGTMGVAGTGVLAALTLGQCISVLATRTNSAIHDLMAGTAVVDYASQTIFRSTEDLIEYQKKVAADRAARDPY